MKTANQPIKELKGIVVKNIISKAVSVPKPKEYEELIQLEKEQSKLFGENSPVLLGTWLELSTTWMNGKFPVSFEECAKYYEKVLKIFDGFDSANATLSILEQYSNLLLVLRKDEKALKMNESILEQKIKLFGTKQNASCAQTISQIAKIQMNMGNFQHAKTLIDEAIKIEKETSNSQRRSVLHHDMNQINACILSNLGEFQEAYRITQELFQIFRMSNEWKTIEALRNMAFNLKSMQKPDEAIKTYIDIKERFEYIGEANSYLFSQALLEFVSFLLTIPNNSKFTEESIAYLEKLIPIQIATVGNSHLETLESMKLLSDVFQNQQKWADALKIEQKRNEGIEKQEQKEESLRRMATIEMELKNFDNALKLMLEIGKEKDIVNAWLISEIYSLQGKEEEKKKSLNHLNNLLLEQNADSHYFLKSTKRIGETLVNAKRFDEALVYLQKYCDHSEKENKQNPIEYPEVLELIAKIYEKKKSTEEAVKILEISLAFEESLEKPHRHQISTLQQISSVLEQQQPIPFEKLSKIHEKTLKLLKKMNVHNINIYFEAQRKQALCVKLSGKLDEAIEILEDCVSWSRNTNPKFSSHLKATSDLAQCYEEKGDLQQAFDSRKSHAAFMSGFFGKNSQEAKQAQIELDRVQSLLDKK